MNYTTLVKELQTVPSVYYDEIMIYINTLKAKQNEGDLLAPVSEPASASIEQKTNAYNALLKIIKPAPKDFDAARELETALTEKYGMK